MANKRISSDRSFETESLCCLYPSERTLRTRKILIELIITDLYFSKEFRGFSGNNTKLCNQADRRSKEASFAFYCGQQVSIVGEQADAFWKSLAAARQVDDSHQHPSCRQSKFGQVRSFPLINSSPDRRENDGLRAAFGRRSVRDRPFAVNRPVTFKQLDNRMNPRCAWMQVFWLAVKRLAFRY